MGKDSKKSSKHESKKESKKKDKKKKSHKKQKEVEVNDDLTSLLNWGLLNHPKFLQDIPAIVIALDKGEYVNIQNISNKSEKDILNSIMKLLPLINDPHNGWYKNSVSVNVSSFILQDLLVSNSIKQPTSLSYSEKISSQSAPFLILNLLQKFPSLKSELPSLFATLIDGSAVQLDFIENEDIREGLEKIFKCLELIEEEDGFIIPETKKHDVVLDSIRQIHDMFTLEASMPLSVNAELDNIVKNNTAHSEPLEPEDDSSSNDSSDDKEHSDDDSDDRQTDSQHRLGPTLPTKEQLAQAQRIAFSLPPEPVDEEDDEDDVGPQLYDSSRDPLLKLKREELQVQPLGFVGLDLDFRKNRSFGQQPVEEEEGDAEEVTEREEWILTPGDSKLIAGSSLNANRKFQTGKLAKKAVEQLSYEKEMRLKNQSNVETEESLRTKKIMEEFREKRGPTLMESHLEKQAKKQKPESSVRRPFDREKDVMSRKKLDPFQVSKLVENAKEIDSRFDKGSVQKSFL